MTRTGEGESKDPAPIGAIALQMRFQLLTVRPMRKEQP